MLQDLAEVQTMAEIRQEHLPSESVGQDKSAEDYLEYLSGKGVALNPKLFPSIFYLKNGLPYTGMAVKQTVGAGEVLIRVPEELIMSTAKAFVEPELHDIFKNEQFFKGYDDWEQDRILIVYCLFLMYKKDETHPWYQMIQRLPRQCDIACFWKEQELEQFKDKTVKSAAKLDLSSFQRQWSAFQQLQSKQILFQNPEFNKDNYKMCFIALNNRAFGTKVKYISLVPMAELFNHHCSKVYYNVQKQKKEDFRDDNFDGYSETSSLGSCDSTDYLEQGEFAYDKIDVTEFSWKIRECFNLNKKQKEKIVEESDRILKKIDDQINWQDYSVLFVGHLIFKIKVIKKQYLAGRKTFEKSIQDLSMINRTIEKYKQAANKHSLSVNKKPYYPIQQKKKEESILTDPKPTKDYQSLIIKTSRFDRTDKNGQIYFKYGPYSNRSLLLRYGFAIQGNKYEHIWLSFNITQCVREFPDVLQKVMTKKLSLLRKYKVYSHRLCMDMIVFFRLNNWSFWGEKAVEEIFTVTKNNYQKEITILSQISEHLQKNITKYDDQYDLTDSSMNYHQYFITVYHIQKLRILQKQTQMISMLTEVLYKLDNGAHFEQATQSLTKSEKIVLAPYLNTIQY